MLSEVSENKFGDVEKLLYMWPAALLVFFLIKQVETFSTFNIGCNDSDMVEKEWQ